MSRIHDVVILGTGHKPGLDHFRADGSFLTPAARFQGLAPENGSYRSNVDPPPLFLGHDRTLLGGFSLWHWAFEVADLRQLTSLR